MSLRRAAKRDASEKGIVDALEAFGFSVQRISEKDTPDLLVGRNGVTRVIEVKTGKAALKQGQAIWWGKWKGNACIVLTEPEQVQALHSYWLTTDRGLSLALFKAAS